MTTETSKSDTVYFILAGLACTWALGCIVGLLRITPDVSRNTQQQNTQEDTPRSTATPSVAAGQQPAQALPFSVTEGNSVYSGARSSDVGVAVLSVASTPFLTTFERVQAAGTFLIVTVAIFNGQSSAISMDTGLFAILDSSGSEYSASVRSADLGANDLFLARINPGITKVGEIVFDVPASLDLDHLQLRFRGATSGDAAIVPLKANATGKPPAEPITQSNDNTGARAAAAAATTP